MDPISEREKTLVFRQGLIREDLQSALILPSRTETFEQLVESERSYIQSTVAASSVSSSSQRMAVDNGCSIAFDPMPEPPTDEEGTPIPRTPAKWLRPLLAQDK